jgi:hypothetical protein
MIDSKLFGNFPVTALEDGTKLLFLEQEVYEKIFSQLLHQDKKVLHIFQKQSPILETEIIRKQLPRFHETRFR